MCLVQATFPLPLSHNTLEIISSSINEVLLWDPHRWETRGAGADRYLLAIQCIPETQAASQQGPSPPRTQGPDIMPHRYLCTEASSQGPLNLSSSASTLKRMYRR